MPEPSPLDERIIALESLVTHLERTVETLNAALLDHQQEIDALQRVIARLDDRVTRLGDDAESDRDPGTERPPHY